MGIEKYKKGKIAIIYLLIILYFIIKILTINKKLENIYKCLIIGYLTIIAIFMTMYLNTEISIYKKFLSIALFIGIALVFAIPMLHGIDEKAHFYKVYSIFYGINEVYDENNNLMYKIPEAIEDCENIDYYLDIKYFENKIINDTETILSIDYFGITLYSNISYLTYLIPVFICQKILNMPIIFVVYISRLFSFLLWVLNSYYTIKIIPKRKEFMAFLCLMPINLTLVTTFTGDLLTNSTILLFIAIWYKLYEEKREIKKIEIFTIVLLGCISACCKIVYALIFLIIFLLPNQVFKNKKNKIIITSCVLLVIALTAILNLSIVGTDLTNAYPKIEEQKNWIISNFFEYLVILYRTTIKMLPSYIYQFATGDTVEPIISLVYFAILILALYTEKTNLKLGKSQKKFILLIVVSIIFVIFTSLYLQWTATNYGIGAKYVYGVQGRYFLPIFALLSLMDLTKCMKIDKGILWNGVVLINFIILLQIITKF